MTATRRPLGALFGVGYFVCGLAGALVIGSSTPDFAGAPDDIAAYYRDNTGQILGADTLFLLSSVLLLAFSGTFWCRAHRAENGDGRTAVAALAGLVAGAACALASAALDGMGALRADEQGEIAPEVATVLYDASSVLYGLAAPMAFAVTVLATAFLCFRHGLFPSWFGVVSVLLGIALLIPPISYFAVIVFSFWVLLAALLLYFRPDHLGNATHIHSGDSIPAGP